MKPQRPSPKLAALAALSLFALACASAAQDSKPERNGVGPFRADEVTKEPYLITFAGQFPVSGDRADERIDGLVRLSAVCTYSGEVKDIKVVKSTNPQWTETAISAAKSRLLKPAEKDGRPVSQYITLEYYFHFFYDFGVSYGGRGFLTKGVKILEQPRPEYTAAQLASGFSGKLFVETVFGWDGVVEGARLWRVENARGEPYAEGVPGGLSERAVAAALRVKFEPAEYQGIRVTAVREVEYVFPPGAPPAPKH
ncbi:MAG TPA: energy transducer TonB [Pyrinomonadaceae bacterium]|jgi:hypothetical protein|nr:energy transducer TonB [Pyrinomonadaceae bacterium]